MKASYSPHVSVIVPVYNVEAYLREAIDSILAQIYQDFEIIIIDDGSTDNSREIGAKYAKEHPERIRYMFQENRGAAAARNQGIRIANGEWLAFLDGDDVWKPYKLERQMQIIEENPSINFIASRADIYGEKNRSWNDSPLIYPSLKLNLLLQGCFIPLPSIVMKKQLIAQAMFDEKIRGGHDIDLYLRIAENSRFFFIEEPLISVRTRKNSLSDLRQSRYIQTSNHYRLVKLEGRRLKAINPHAPIPYASEFQQAMRRLSHEAAYAALMSSHVGFIKKVSMIMTAIQEHPSNLKNYRFLIQSMLPAKINAELSRLLRH